MTRPLILVTNDDGIHSPGLHAAIQALDDLGDLLIIAPTQQQSGMARSLPMNFDGRIQPIQMTHQGRKYPAYHIQGSPAQCVLYGTLDCARRRPNLVVSGINYGENLGNSTQVSGTVGAALQGGDMGIPSLAISLETKKEYHYDHGQDVDWSAASYWLHFFAQRALATQPWPQDLAVLKIDIPATATPETAWRLATQSTLDYYISIPSGRKTPQEPIIIDYEARVDENRLEKNSDVYIFAVERQIPVVPLSVNLTARIAFADFASHLAGHHE
jgi:5'-nucleotidase